MRYSIFFLSLIMFCSRVMAQVNITFSDQLAKQSLEKQYHLDMDMQTKVLETLTTKLNNYRKYARLINPNTRTIDRESIGLFKDLFTLDANLFNDLREYEEGFLYPVEGYVNLARNYFNDGIPFGINKAQVTAIEYNPLNERYTFTLYVNKTVEAYYTESGKVMRGAKTYDLEFLYTLKLREIDNARIQLIRKKGGKTPDVFTQFMGVHIGTGFVSVNTQPSNFFTTKAKSGGVSIVALPELQFGLNWMSNFFNKRTNPNKMLFLSGSISGSYQRLTGKLRNFSLADRKISDGLGLIGNNVVDTLYKRVTEVQVNEVHNLGILRIGLGVDARLIRKNTIAVFAGVAYTPSYTLFSNSDLNGTGNFHLYTSSGTWASNQNEAINPDDYGDFERLYGISTSGKIVVSQPKLKFNFMHAVTVSSTFMRDFIDDDPTLGMSLKVFAFLPFTEPWKEEYVVGSAVPFENPTSSVYGVIQPFTENTRASIFGITIGVYQKRSRKP